MGARFVGAGVLSGLARLGGLLVLVWLAAACTGGEVADAELLPTNSPTLAEAATVTPRPTPTERPTSTPLPTPTATSTPEPTATPTGTERFGPLLVEGVVDWPTEMPDDLTDQELFAINVFASMENATWLAGTKEDMTIPELDLLRPYVGPSLFEFIEDSIALYEAAGEQPLLPSADRRMEFVRVERTTSEAAPKAFIVCLHLDSQSRLIETGDLVTRSQSVQTEIWFLQVGDIYTYGGWKTISVDDGEFTCDDS